MKIFIRFFFLTLIALIEFFVFIVPFAILDIPYNTFALLLLPYSFFVWCSSIYFSGKIMEDDELIVL